MTDIFKRLMMAILLMCLCVLANPAIVGATGTDLFVNVNGVDCTGSASKSAICTEHSTTDNPLTGCPSNCGGGIINSIVNIVAYVAGAAAIILIIVSALQFITSGSDTSTGSRTDEDVENAKRTIANSLIGLAIIVLAKVLITYVVKKL